MNKFLSARDVQALLRSGGDLSSIPTDAILTPSARDLLLENQLAPAVPPRPAQREAGRGEGPSGMPPAPAYFAAPAQVQVEWPQVAPHQIESFFASPDLSGLKDEICGIGRRLWQRAYVDGNGGNISVRVAAELVLCTPTLVSKGFMTPADLCLVDMEGVQKAGVKKRTSEVLMHLEMYKAQPAARSIVHAHPPYATGFAVAGLSPPTCMIPEMEVFCGEVPVAPYGTPGTIEVGRMVAALVGQHNTILMANHGVVSWGRSVEDAYFKMEILEAYCRTVLVASQLGKPVKTMTPTQLQDLLKIKQNMGIPDPRFGLKECELCDNSDWRGGVTGATPAPPPDADVEVLVRQITDEIVRALGR